MISNNTKVLLSEVPEESENDSQKTKDTLYLGEGLTIFKQVELILEKTGQALVKINDICDSVTVSDKIIRLIGAVFKFLKNFKILANLGLFDKLSSQISQLRRLLRINRILLIIRDLIKISSKKQLSKKDYFDLFFKSVMFFGDINDMILYLMQLKVIQERFVPLIRKNCLLWTCQHFYDYFTKQHKNIVELKNRRLNVFKYLMDSTTSHNDFSGKIFEVDLKNLTLIGLVSSIIGFVLVYK